MPITGLPTFTSGILTAAQLNAIVTALEDKFASKIGTGDLTWPLVAGGNINMGQYSVTNLGSLWGIYDLSARAAGDSIQDVLDAAAAAGGGYVILPGGYSETLPDGGITVGNNVFLVGHGKASQLTMSSSATDTAITVSGNYAGVMELDLVAVAGVDQTLLDVSGDYCRASGLTITDAHGTQPLTRISGNAKSVKWFFNKYANVDTGGQDSTPQLRIDGCDGAQLFGCEFRDYADAAIDFSPNTGSAVNNVQVSHCQFHRNSVNTDALSARGAITWTNADAVSCTGLAIVGCTMDGTAAEARGISISGGGLTNLLIDDNEIIVGSTLPAVQIWNNVSQFCVSNNRIGQRTNQNALVINCSTGTESTPTFGTCQYFTVADNNIAIGGTDQVTAVLVGIPASGGLYGTFVGNNISGVGQADHIQVMNCGASGNKAMHLAFFGNVTYNHGPSSNTGLRLYATTTTDANVGSGATAVWFTAVGNVFHNLASGTQYTYSVANKCIVADNVV